MALAAACLRARSSSPTTGRYPARDNVRSRTRYRWQRPPVPWRRGKSLFHHFMRAERKRPAVADQRARTERSGSDQRRPLGIAGAQRDLVGRHPENSGHQIGEYGLVPLPRWPGQREQLRQALCVEPDGDFLLAGAPRWLDEDRATDAAQPAARLGLRTPAARRRSSQQPSVPPPSALPDRRCRRSIRSGSCRERHPSPGDFAAAVRSGRFR